MHAPPPIRHPISQPVRWLLAALAFGLGIMLAMARSLEPDPRGFGTHERLGLAPCSFLASTGRPCPFCGATTAVAWAARGRPVESWKANPAGALLGLLAAPLIAWLIASALTGRPVGCKTTATPLAGLLLLIVAVGSAFWLLRFLDGPSDLAPAGAAPAFDRAKPGPEPRKEGAKDDPPDDDEDATSRRRVGGHEPLDDPDGLRPAHAHLLPPAV